MTRDILFSVSRKFFLSVMAATLIMSGFFIAGSAQAAAPVITDAATVSPLADDPVPTNILSFSSRPESDLDAYNGG